MTKPLPPKDKYLKIWELANLPEGAEVEYWQTYIVPTEQGEDCEYFDSNEETT